MRSLSFNIDARGLNCPEPVILTKKSIDQGEERLVIIVDNLAARENVSKLGISQGYDVTVEPQEGFFQITMQKQAAPDPLVSPASDSGQENRPTEVSILVKSDLFGDGDPELGQVLMKSFLYTLNETANIKYVVFMNRGVLLTVAGSPVLDQLQALQDLGVSLLSCGTCLDFYNKKDKLAVGTITNMYNAMEILTSTPRNLTI